MRGYSTRKDEVLRCWLYGRLSRDEDKELNSMNNQLAIGRDYIEDNHHIFVGQSFDDNVTGMTFERKGIDEMVEAVEDGKIDAVVVKDLSRLGRNRVQSAVFVEYLLEKGVRVLSVTENIDTSNEEDDLLIGVKQLTNDLYAKDTSRRIRYGYHQKQKEGLVIVPPFGYFKDKNTKQVVIVPEAAATVQLMFQLYLDGMGDKKITQYLSERGHKSPSKVQHELLGKVNGRATTENGKRFLWNEKTVQRILQDEQYTGVLINRKTARSKINKQSRIIPQEEQYRHEGVLPVIIEKDIWCRVQAERKRRDINNVHGRHGNKLVNRYAGLLKCGECGASFTALHRKSKDGERIEYVCSNYHRIGKIACSQHRVREEVLDELLMRELRTIKRLGKKNWGSVQSIIQQYISNLEVSSKIVAELKSQVEQLRDDNRNLTRQISRSRDDAQIDAFSAQMLENQQEMDALTERINQINDTGVSFDKKLKTLKTSIDLLDDILAAAPIGNATLRDIVERIKVYQVEEGLVDIEFTLKAPFQSHVELDRQFGVIKKLDADDTKGIAENLHTLLEKIGA